MATLSQEMQKELGQAATTADNATFQHRLDAIRKEQAAKAVAAITKCAPIKERLQDFAAEPSGSSASRRH